jgi:hypothetical protein
MRQRTGAMLSAAVLGVAVIALFSIDGRQAKADDPNSAPNPYHVVDHWAKLPPDRTWGQAIGIDIDPDGTSVWVYDRCGGKTCVGSSVAPIQKLDATGKVVTSFGAGSVNWPHGLGVDQDGTQAGLPLASARSIAAGRSAERSTYSPWPPSAMTT